MEGNLAEVRANLFWCKGEERCRVDWKDDGWTPLQRAAYSGRVDIAEALIKAGASLELVHNNGRTALFDAAKGGSLAMTKLLVEAGADTKARSADGETVLATAEKNGHADVADYLRELGGHP